MSSTLPKGEKSVAGNLINAGLKFVSAPYTSYKTKQVKTQIEELEKNLMEKQKRLDLIKKHLPRQKEKNVDNTGVEIKNESSIQDWENEQKTLENEINEIQNTLASMREKINKGGKSRRKKKRTKKSKKSKRKRSRKTRK
jgi:chromosome segregation ATPase